MIYLISDTHFNHKNILRYCNRPFKSIEDMNSVLIENWNNVVSKKDTIYHLGDFAWGNKETVSKLLSKLNGNKILIKGNHDRKSCKWYLECGIEVCLDGGILLNDKYLLTHKPIGSSFVNIHGHIHNDIIGDNKHINVSVEQINYTPVLFEEAIK